MGKEYSTDDTLKNNIVNTSIRLFLEQGYVDTTIRQIACESGIGRGHLYYYFKKKEDILLFLFHTLIVQIYEAAQPFAAAANDFAAEYALQRYIYFTVLQGIPPLFRIFREAAQIPFLRREYMRIMDNLFADSLKNHPCNADPESVFLSSVAATSTEFELIEYGTEMEKIVRTSVAVRFSLFGPDKEAVQASLAKAKALYDAPKTRSCIEALSASINRQLEQGMQGSFIPPEPK